MKLDHSGIWRKGTGTLGAGEMQLEEPAPGARGVPCHVTGLSPAATVLMAWPPLLLTEHTCVGPRCCAFRRGSGSLIPEGPRHPTYPGSPRQGPSPVLRTPECRTERGSGHLRLLGYGFCRVLSSCEDLLLSSLGLSAFLNISGPRRKRRMLSSSGNGLNEKSTFLAVVTSVCKQSAR
ncbi:uncharacterized protein LOC144283315 [Canis aureus]